MDVRNADPKGLIRESYRIDGITLSECRTIFFEWAIQVPPADAPEAHIKSVLDHYGAGNQDHPMTSVLTQALDPAPQMKRRGGRQGRVTAQGQRRDGRES